MKIGIYNPYLDSFGGGERYVLTIAQHWSKSHAVDIFWNNPDTISESARRFGLDLSRTHTVRNIFSDTPFLMKVAKTMQYDLILVVSDGSVPVSLARRNILHFQVPFARVHFPFWKKYLYRLIIVNSEFTRNHLAKSPGLPVRVIYPPVFLQSVDAKRKEKIILTVGRFGGLYNAKKHDILIRAFRELYTEGTVHGWKLVLCGSLLKSDEKDLQNLKKESAGIPVEFYPNCPYGKLLQLYNAASIYWHAAGYSAQTPEHMEHFGISTVEAMNAGCIPVVFGGGGQKEIIEEGTDGFLWNTPEDLKNRTLSLVKNPDSMDRMRNNAIKKSRIYSVGNFTDAFDAVLREIL